MRSKLPEPSRNMRSKSCSSRKPSRLTVTANPNSSKNAASSSVRSVPLVVIEKPDRDTQGSGASRGVSRGIADHWPIRERLAPQERQVDATSLGVAVKKEVDRAASRLLRHRFRRPAKAPLLSITVSAAEVAFLCDRQRKRMNRRDLRADDRRSPAAHPGRDRSSSVRARAASSDLDRHSKRAASSTERS